MFQFRRFPAYAYFIQRTLREYCSRGFPHSEIPGSMDICSSPRLIAACHVLHRLLMPRHSPCALYSLTSSAQAPYPSLRPVGLSSLIPLRLLFAPQTLRWFAARFRSRSFLLIFHCSNLSENLGSLELCRLSQRSSLANCFYPSPFGVVPQLNMLPSRFL